jgi:ABC-type sulfate transport system permease component
MTEKRSIQVVGAILILGGNMSNGRETIRLDVHHRVKGKDLHNNSCQQR